MNSDEHKSREELKQEYEDFIKNTTSFPCYLHVVLKKLIKDIPPISTISDIPEEYIYSGNLPDYKFLIEFSIIPPVLEEKKENKNSILNKVLYVRLTGDNTELNKIKNFMKSENHTSQIKIKINIDKICNILALQNKTETETKQQKNSESLTLAEAMKIENINPKDYGDDSEDEYD